MSEDERGHNEPAVWADQEVPGPRPPGERRVRPERRQTTEGVVQINTEDEQTIGGGSEPVRQGEQPDRLSPLPVIVFIGLAGLILVVVLLALLVGLNALG